MLSTNNERVSEHAEMIILRWLQTQIQRHKVNGKIRIYVFRITKEKTERSKFMGSIGHLKNVYFCSAEMCWRCAREIRGTFAETLKWLTPTENGWESAIKEKSNPSVGTITYWIKNGISKKEYEELKKYSDYDINTHKIKIRQ